MTNLHFVLTLVAVSAGLSLVMTAAWFIQQRTGNSGWVDTIWTFGLGLIGFIGALVPVAGASGFTLRQGVVASLIVVWSLRLGLHIAHRTTGIKDDPRYAHLQQSWGDDSARQMFWLLQKQAIVSIPLALSMILAAWNPIAGLRVQDIAGILVLAVATVGEGIADRQLRQFKARPGNKNKICDVGMWSWSRHPNYFFEWMGWVAYPLFAVDATGHYPWGWFALAGPACMYWLLVHVSGIPPLEEHMVRAHGDAFRDYQARTSAFFPVPPRIS